MATAVHVLEVPACDASARKPLEIINLASTVHALKLLAMHLTGSRWKEIGLASAEHILDLLAMRLPGSRWKVTKLAGAMHVLKLFAMLLLMK